MTSTELRERLIKAQEKATKIEGTISKHQAKAEKKLAALQKMGYNNRDEVIAARDTMSREMANELYWLACDYHSALEDAKSCEKKLKEQMQVVANWQERLDRQVEVETKFIKEVPEAFKQAREDLKARWIEYDIKARDEMKQKRHELDYSTFRKMYSYTAEQELLHTDEEFAQREERESMLWVIDLYNRVYNITGKATDCSSLYFNGKALNGMVIGERGMAEVETIVAGGYNIQRAHYRVLVHKR